MPQQPNASAAAIAAVWRSIEEHQRVLSPTGKGALCACGQQYPSPSAWREHQAAMATAAAEAILTPPTP